MGSSHDIRLKIHLHGIGVGDGVAQRRAGCKNYAAPVVLLLNAAHFSLHMQALLRAPEIYSRYIFLPRVDRNVLEIMSLIDKEGVYLQFVECDLGSCTLHRHDKLMCGFAYSLLNPVQLLSQPNGLAQKRHHLLEL